jgi:hypothetical protein
MSLYYSFNVNEVKFINYFMAQDYALKTNGYVDFKLSDEDVKIFENIDLDNVNKNNIKNLYIQKLIFLRDTFPKLRLLYSGGTDSHTILSMAQELGIEFDDIVVEVASMWGDKDVDPETYYGILYAKKNKIKNFRINYPTIETYERFLNTTWLYDECGSQRFPFRNRYDLHLRNSETMINITGKEKPWIYVSEQGKFYWVLPDLAYNNFMRYDHVPFFLDTFVPEAAVKQAYNAVDYLKTFYPNFQGLWTGELNNNNLSKSRTYNRILGRLDPLCDITLKSKPSVSCLNHKQLAAMRECEKIGREDIVQGFFNSWDYVKKTYSDRPHCFRILKEGVPASIVKFGAVFEINENYVKQVDDSIITF